MDGLSDILKEISPAVASYKTTKNLDNSSTTDITDTTSSTLGSSRSNAVATPIAAKETKKHSKGAPFRRTASKPGHQPIRRVRSNEVHVNAKKGGVAEENPLNSSVAFYDDFDYSMSEVQLSGGGKVATTVGHKDKGQHRKKMGRGTGGCSHHHSKLESVGESTAMKDSSVRGNHMRRKDAETSAAAVTHRRSSSFNDTFPSVYDEFDFSLSSVTPSIAAEEKSRRGASRTSLRGSGRYKKDSSEVPTQKEVISSFNDTIPSLYDTFDFSLSSVTPSLAEEEKRRRSARRSSLGGTMTDGSCVTPSNRNARIPREAQKSARARMRQESNNMKLKTPRCKRPGLVRRNSIGSSRDLVSDRNNKPDTDFEMERTGKMSTPKTMRSIRNRDAGIMSPLDSSSQRRQRGSRRATLATPSTGRRPTVKRSNSIGSTKKQEESTPFTPAMKGSLASSGRNRQTPTPSTRHRPALKRSNSIGSTRDLKKVEERSSHPMGNSSRNQGSVRRWTARRQSLAGANATNKQLVEVAVDFANEKEDKKVRTMQKAAVLKKTFAAAATGLESSIRRSRTSLTS